MSMLGTTWTLSLVLFVSDDEISTVPASSRASSIDANCGQTDTIQHNLSQNNRHQTKTHNRCSSFDCLHDNLIHRLTVPRCLPIASWFRR
eukprot:m.355819 g.355819  ORF g.355819 m.355819 type:complete len:90 (+) comp16600_c0_seq3:511-780(+)